MPDHTPKINGGETNAIVEFKITTDSLFAIIIGVIAGLVLSWVFFA